MGDAARAVTGQLLSALRERHSAATWTTEYDVAGTPVDIAGETESRLVLVELEWRRADPVNNTAKLFRVLSRDALRSFDRIHVVQAFSEYYALSSGGLSTKRLNASFVGERVAETFDRVDYAPVTLGVDPPKRGGSLPESWAEATADVADAVLARLDESG